MRASRLDQVTRGIHFGVSHRIENCGRDNNTVGVGDGWGGISFARVHKNHRRAVRWVWVLRTRRYWHSAGEKAIVVADFPIDSGLVYLVSPLHQRKTLSLIEPRQPTRQ